MSSDSILVNNMETVWGSIASLCRDLEETQWRAPTDCPGWSVQDQLSHLTGAEASILRRPRPDHLPQDTSFVRNEVGRSNEVLVDWRRRSPGSEVLEEFIQVTGERMQLLNALAPQDFDQAMDTPIGPGTMRDFLSIRIFDAWVHEQDMRRALAAPGHMEGPVVRHSLDRMCMALPFVTGKKAEAADGATVVFRISGPEGRTVCIGVEDRRAKEIELPADPSVVLTLDVETFTCLCCGRRSPEQVIEAGKVGLEGDQVLGQTIVDNLNFMI
jgi:uncharacterized protein (TIGR03083 family)